MTLAHKITSAFVTALAGPAFTAFVVFGRWSRDNVDISLPALIYLVPLLLAALVIRRVFRARRFAAGIYVLGMGTLLALAIASFWGELEAPLFGQIYVPTILLTFPFGLMAILHKSVGDHSHAHTA